jgi:hypothetical protein
LSMAKSPWVGCGYASTTCILIISKHEEMLLFPGGAIS